jgi:hypothetical protein
LLRAVERSRSVPDNHASLARLSWPEPSRGASNGSTPPISTTAIAADQAGSIALHEKLGFAKVAYLREVGFKFGRFLDVVFLQQML